MKNIISTIIISSFLCACANYKKPTNKTELSFPIYGNYCGPLHPPKGLNPVPLDGVDSACKKHDKCYDNLGYFNKSCDLQIIEELKITNPQSENEKLAQKLLIFYFQEASKI